MFYLSTFIIFIFFTDNDIISLFLILIRHLCFLFLSQTAQTVLVVVVVFGISWLPHHVIHLWAEFGVFPLTQASFLFRVAAHCLAYSNSSVNPIIYAFLSENFRKAYKQVFKCQIGNESPLNDAKESKSRIDTPPSTNCTHVWTLESSVCWLFSCVNERHFWKTKHNELYHSFFLIKLIGI